MGIDRRYSFRVSKLNLVDSDSTSSLLKYAIRAYFNLAKFAAELLTARETAAFWPLFRRRIHATSSPLGISTGCYARPTRPDSVGRGAISNVMHPAGTMTAIAALP